MAATRGRDDGTGRSHGLYHPGAMSTTPASTRTIGRWPFGLLVVAVLRIANAVWLLQVGLSGVGSPRVGVPILIGDATVTRAADVTLAVLTIVGVIGLLLLQRWGWVLTVVLVGVGLLGDLIRVGIGAPDYLSLLFMVVSAFYLNGRAIRALVGVHFGAHDDRADERGGP